MKSQVRKFAAGAVAAGALAAVGVFALPAGTADWNPVSYGLTSAPEEIVPAVVTEAQPARVVSTTLDEDGRPVVTVKEATDKAAALALVEAAQQADRAIGVEMDAPVHALGVPTGSDPYRAQQYSLSKVRVTEAWQRSTGAGVTVAVIDSGVDANHADLKGNVLSGYDAITDRAGSTSDKHGHGTHVAGTIAAVTGNGVGVTAVAPDVKILPVKVLGDNGSGNMSDTAEGIVWAADNGAQVINMSLGSTAKVAAVTNAIKYARGKGVTVIAAAGNSRREGSPTSYPAADEGVIGVAATDSSDRIGEYSTAGGFVDVAAPGSGIVSTYPSALGASYKSMNGTSMAAPHVAAVAALMKSYNTALTPDQIESALEKSAVDLGAKGFDNDFGHGRIDAVAALDAVAPATPPTTAPTTPPTKAPTTPPTSAPVTTPPTKAPTTPPTSAPVTTPPATTAPAPGGTKVTPEITADVTSAEVVYGTSTTTTFSVTAGGRAWAGQPVEVCVTEAGADEDCTAATTGVNGIVRLNRTATATYQVVLKAVATDASEESVSAAVSYQVKAAVTVVRVGRGQLGVTLTGATGQATEVQQRVGAGWRTIGTWTAPASPSRVTISGLAPGQTYRMVVPDSPAVAGVASAPIVA
ncbi:S8 family serine peptidase [Actinoplanes sp. G11-F43]|uniref:S8 family serine peptidase n=1 Tax=Actinoplanes sp. G11-F43 TaxID=3424130 RepID=UPI003D342507